LIWVGVDHGGYFPPAWGWAGLAFGWIATMSALLRKEIEIGRRELVFLGGLASLIAWSAVSLAWTSDVSIGVQDLERDLVYVSAVVVAISLRDRLGAAALRNGVLVGASVVCAYSLGTRLFPDRLGVYSDALGPGRLYNPLGYWNAQGVLAVLAMILATGVVANRGMTLARSIAAGLVPVLALDCYFTLSRGALVALALGAAAWLAVDPARIRSSIWLIIVAPWPVIAVWRARGMTQLFGSEFGIHSASAGHHLAWQLLACSLTAATVVAVLSRVEDRVQFPNWAARAYVVYWAGIAVVVVLVSIARFGTPAEMTRSVYDAFAAPPPSNTAPSRVLSLSLHGRNYLWTVAWDDAVTHPVGGSGIGSFEQRWLRNRPLPSDSRWAHSLYLETLAEGGLIGLLLLCGALAAPLVAAIRTRSQTVVPSVFGAYSAYLGHAGVDWDWQVPGLTLAAIWCACGALAAGDQTAHLRLIGKRRAGAIAAIAAIAILAVFGLAGNRDLALSQAAATRGDFRRAAADASAAARWQPWSYLPWMASGQAEQAAGHISRARVAYAAATRRDPGRWDAWLALAGVSTSSERAAAVRRALELNPLAPQIAAFCQAHPHFGCPPKP
jgi:hypothetical protein